MEKIQFRRIRGRIIPIKTRQQEKRLENGKKAAAYLGAGAATVVAAGEVGSQLTKAAAKTRMAAKFRFGAANSILRNAKIGQTFFDFGGGIRKAAKLKKISVLMRKGSFLIRKARRPALIAGTLASAYLIGEGLQKAKESITGKRHGKVDEFLTQAAGTVAAGAVGAYYYKRLGLGFRQALRTARAASKGNPYKFGAIPIKTKYGQLKFRL